MQSNRKWSRWDSSSNQVNTWHPPPPPVNAMNNWGHGPGPWMYPPPGFPPHPNQFNQFAPYQNPYWNFNYGHNGNFLTNQQPNFTDFSNDTEEWNPVNSDTAVCQNGQSEDVESPHIEKKRKGQKTEKVKKKGNSLTEGGPQNCRKKGQTIERVTNKGSNLTESELQNSQKKGQTSEKVINKGSNNPKEAGSQNCSKRKETTGEKSKGKKCPPKSGKSPQPHHSPKKSGARQNGTNCNFPSNVRRSPHNGTYLGSAHHGKSWRFSNRGGTFESQVYDEDETNEINQWLVYTESISGKDKNSVSNDPLPNSEEARSNAIKEAADRLKQALKNKKSVNVNVDNLLSSGEESKSDNQAGKLKPKNLAELQLDATDMREIGRANNTDKANCHDGEISDDDIIEVQRSPTLSPQVIDLDEISPTKSSCTSSSDSDEDEDIPLHQRLLRSQNLNREWDRDGSLEPGNDSSTLRSDEDRPLARQINSLENPCEVFQSSNCQKEDNLPKESRQAGSPESVALNTGSVLEDEPLKTTVSPRAAFMRKNSVLSSPTAGKQGDPISPPLSSGSNFDLRQRKIISDLKKMNQSRLKDLINNPRAGKLDFAIKSLMKEHQEHLSRHSRDVAEKRIPGHFLNRKNTDLPLDDSTICQDYAIDWSSLPGELISTLGDLFEDFGAEIQENNAIDEMVCPTGQSEDDMVQPSKPINTETSNTVKIRVCQFAREKLCPSSDNMSSTVVNNFEPSCSNPLINETDLLLGESPSEVADNAINGPNDRVECSKQSEDENHTPVTDESLEDANGPLSESLDLEGEASMDVTQHQQIESIPPPRNIAPKTAVMNLPKASEPATTNKKRIRGGKKKNKQKLAKATMIQAAKVTKKKKFIHLEGRSWFVEQTILKKANSCPQSKTKKNTSRKPSSEKNGRTKPLNDNGFQITEAVPSENVVGEKSSSECVEVANSENQKDPPCDNSSHTSKLSNMPPVQNQSVSMLPVLMMTVPANGISNAVCTLTVTEMQKRIAEIDTILQDLVQERCILAQSLKAAESVGDCSSSTSQNVPSMPSDPQSLRQDGSMMPITEINTVSKRKLTDDHEISKRVCHDTSQSLQSIPQASSLASLDSSQDQSRVISPSHRLENDQNKIMEIPKAKEDKAPDNSKRNPGSTEGSVLAMQVVNSKVFAASSNGLVYWFYDYGMGDTKKVYSAFGTQENGRILNGAVTCLEVVGSYLYTGSEHGILSIYSIPSTGQENVVLSPIFTYVISNSIQCMAAKWDFIYIGTKAGSVVPFKLKTREIKEPLSSGDYPILCIKCYSEGPRKVLIVSSRHQPIAIRDATTGLLLRSLGEGGSEWTVYSVLCHNNMVFCGTNTDKISVFDFQSGQKKTELKTGPGIVDMKESQNFLFCGCYNGKIYVYCLKSLNFVGSIDGPGNMILTIAFANKNLYCSSKNRPLTMFKNAALPYLSKYPK